MAGGKMMTRSQNQTTAMVAAALMVLAATPFSALAETSGTIALESLPLPITPPALDYDKICRKAENPQPLSIDWTAWTRELPPLPPSQILADANRLIDGGAGVVRDLRLARRLLEHLVEDRRATGLGAKRRLALLLLDQRAGPTDRDRAARLLVEATAGQETDAALTLGRLIARGELPSLPSGDAARYLGIAAGFGEPMAAVELAALYADGTLAEPFAGAATHFANLATINVQTALSQGECDLSTSLGQFLLDRNLPDADQLSVAWFAIAARAGHRTGLEKLAKAYENGIGVAADKAKARKLWDEAIAQGSVTGYAAAAEIELLSGSDPTGVEDLLLAGIENNDPSAVLLGARYFRGDFTGIADFDQMQAVLQPAADRTETSVFALDILANSYLTGQGVAPDPARAEKLYRRIQAFGTADAQALYGRYLLKWGGGLEAAQVELQAGAERGSALARASLVDIALCRPTSGLDPDRWLADVAKDGNGLAIRKQARRAFEAGDKASAQTFFALAAAKGDRISMIERAGALIAKAGAPTKASHDLVAAAGSPGENVVSGRLALVQAYRSGKLGPDAGTSTALLQSLARSLDPTADFELARVALEGGVVDDEVRTRLERAAIAGHPGAMRLLARVKAQDGSSLEADAWLLRAAGRGDPEALGALGNEPDRLLPVAKLLDTTLLCDPESLVHKARIHRLLDNPLASSEALSTAEAIVRHSPRLRLVLAEAILSLSPAAGDDAMRAARLLNGAADKGSGKAAFVLARLEESDRLGNQREAAIDWYRRAALQGEQSAIPELARLAEGGSAQDAMDALKQVAETGDPSALRSVGILLATRDEDSRSEGIRLLEEAARKSDVAAMKMLARFHATGIDGAVSAAKSTDWTRLAAEQGDPEAMFQYAIALDLGFGVASDPQTAKTWHKKALQNGYVE
jgi:TPR repeat protein